MSTCPDSRLTSAAHRRHPRRNSNFCLPVEISHEYLLTEYSHKYTLESSSRIAAAAGLAVRRVWSDPRDWFSVLLLEPA